MMEEMAQQQHAKMMKSNTISGVLPVYFTVFSFTSFSTVLPRIVLAVQKPTLASHIGGTVKGF